MGGRAPQLSKNKRVQLHSSHSMHRFPFEMQVAHKRYWQARSNVAQMTGMYLICTTQSYFKKPMREILQAGRNTYGTVL
jgi:hypothetical protein